MLTIDIRKKLIHYMFFLIKHYPIHIKKNEHCFKLIDFNHTVRENFSNSFKIFKVVLRQQVDKGIDIS